MDHDLNKGRNVTSLLVIGGARSGKSGFAQNLAETSGKHPVLIATAQAFDEEMAALKAVRCGLSFNLLGMQLPQIHALLADS